MKKRLFFIFTLSLLVYVFIPSQVSANMSTDGDSYVVEEDETWTDKSFSGDVYIPKGNTLTTQGKSSITGDVYIFGTLKNEGRLTVNGTLNCLYYSTSGMTLSAGDYSYGILESSGTMEITTLNVTDNYLDTPIPETHVHEWIKSDIKKQDCFTNWVQIYYCSGCDEEKRESIEPTGHTWSDWEIDIDPGCLTAGRRFRQCTTCYELQKEEVPAYGSHDWDDWEIDLAPDCLNPGTAIRYCKICDVYEEKTLAIAPNSHDFSNCYATKRATALSKGKKERECFICGLEQFASIPKLSAKVTLKTKSITIKTKKTYTLKVKSYTYGDKISKWTSKNKKIATVNSKGKVTGKKKGTTTITLKMKSGAKATCKVKVK
jgi:hypothetical protein